MKKGVLGILLRGNRGWSHESVLVMLRVATFVNATLLC